MSDPRRSGGGRSLRPIARLLEPALSAAVGAATEILDVVPVGGGCVNRAGRVETSRGPFFAKWHDSPPPGMFAAEAMGLAAMRASDTPLVLPEPVAWRDGGDGAIGFLVTTWLPRGQRGPDFDARLGVGLASLHRACAPAFGFEADGTCGSTPQPNGWCESWPAFYRDRRLAFQVRLARDAGRMTGADLATMERVIARIDRWIADDATPSLIHGDLWSGNLWVGAGGAPGLVDPAPYYAHREAELGMMTLFGGFGPRVYDAYDEAWPLQPGWRERNGLYQLYHLLNHWNLFGESYREQTLGVARRFA